jgi:hypothetical protein
MPYQPTVTDRTGEFLFRGITGAADSLSDAMKQRKQQSQKASTLRKTIGVYNPELKDEVQTMGLADLEGYVAGLGMKAAQDKLAQDQANKDREFNLAKLYADLQQGTLARTNERDAAGRRFTQGLAARATAGGAPSMDFANTLAGEPQPARELGFTDIVQEAGASGLAMQPVELAPLLRAEQMGQRGNAGAAFMPTGGEIDINGLKVPYVTTSPNSAQPLREMIADNPRYAKKGGDLTPTLRRQYERDADRIQKELEEANSLRNLPGRAERADYLRRRLQEIQTILGPADAAAPSAAGAVVGGDLGLDDFNAWNKARR